MNETLENLSTLKGQLQHPEAKLRWQAAISFCGELAASAVPELAALLGDENASVRVAAALALRWAGPAEGVAVPALMKALKDEDVIVRTNSAGALREVGPLGKDAIPALAAALADQDQGVRWNAAIALTAIGPTAASLPPLLAALKDEDKDVRLDVMRALASLGPMADAALPALTEAVSADDGLASVVAATAIWKIRGHLLDVLPTLVKAIRSPDDSTRRETLDVLGQIGPDEQVISILRLGLRDTNPGIRIFAAQIMWKFHQPANEIIPHLLDSLTNTAWVVREWAALLLETIGAEARLATPALLSLLEDPVAAVRAAAVKALQSIDPTIRT